MLTSIKVLILKPNWKNRTNSKLQKVMGCYHHSTGDIDQKSLTYYHIIQNEHIFQILQGQKVGLQEAPGWWSISISSFNLGHFGQKQELERTKNSQYNVSGWFGDDPSDICEPSIPWHRTDE